MSDPTVLDASALLCLLNQEAGSVRVAEALADSIVSAVNLSEVAAKLSEYGMDHAAVVSALSSLHLSIVAFDEEQAIIAGMLRRETRKAGLSFGDRACLALAKSTGRAALTADQGWAKIASSVSISVEVLR